MHAITWKEDVEAPDHEPIAAGSKYEEHFPDLLVEHMSKGLSFDTFAATVGVTARALYQWCSMYKRFAAAKEKGAIAMQLWWEKAGMKGMLAPQDFKFNATVWIFTMKNRFGMRDVLTVDQANLQNPETLSPRELEDTIDQTRLALVQLQAIAESKKEILMDRIETKEKGKKSDRKTSDPS